MAELLSSQAIRCERPYEFAAFFTNDGMTNFTALRDRQKLELHEFGNLYRIATFEFFKDIHREVGHSPIPENWSPFTEGQFRQRINSAIGNCLLETGSSGLKFELIGEGDFLYTDPEPRVTALFSVFKKIFMEALKYEHKPVKNPFSDLSLKEDKFQIIIRPIPFENAAVNLSDASITSDFSKLDSDGYPVGWQR